MTQRTLWLATVLAGCGLPREDFIVELARARCAEGCASDALEVFSESAVECRSAVRDDVDTVTADCSYRSGRGKRCLAAVEEDCTFPPEDGSCDRAFNCDWVDAVR